MKDDLTKCVWCGGKALENKILCQEHYDAMGETITLTRSVINKLEVEIARREKKIQ